MYNNCIMATINVSIPDKLKEKAEKLVKEGYFASFSDIVRTSLRSTIEENIYNLLGDEAEREYAEGKTIGLKTKKDIVDFVSSLGNDARTSSNNQLRKTSGKTGK